MLDVPKTHILQSFKDVAHFKTEKGSIYTYKADGTTVRYKETEKRESKPKDAIVFIPDYESLKRLAPPGLRFEEIFGKNEFQYLGILSGHIHTEGSRNYVVNGKGMPLETNAAIDQEPGQIFLLFQQGDTTKFDVPVSKIPKLKYYPYDTRKYFDNKKGVWIRERHMGHKVVEIKTK